MPRYPSRSPDLALPVASLAALRRALAQHVGEDAAAHALRAAGHAAGDAFATALLQADAREEMGQRAFFRRLSDLFATRGWGHISHTDVHAGVGMLEATDWVEAHPDFKAVRPSCFFTTGMLANVLGHAAGSDVAVLEAECRSRGDVRCRFLFGAPETLDAAFEAGGASESVERLVAALD